MCLVNQLDLSLRSICDSSTLFLYTVSSLGFVGRNTTVSYPKGKQHQALMPVHVITSKVSSQDLPDRRFVRLNCCEKPVGTGQVVYDYFLGIILSVLKTSVVNLTAI